MNKTKYNKKVAPFSLKYKAREFEKQSKLASKSIEPIEKTGKIK